jgi:5-methylcytosine-specific restriction endonuclease McrA
MSDQAPIYLHIVTAGGNVAEADEDPPNRVITKRLESLYGRRRGTFAALARDDGDRILFVYYEGRDTYDLSFLDERRGLFENTDSDLSIDQIIDIVISFADDDNWWRENFHWERSREAELDAGTQPSKRTPSRRTRKHHKRPSDHWMYRERSKLTPGLRYQVLNRDGFRCQVCGASAIEGNVKLEVDHVVPVVKGGRTELKNLRVACQPCNRGKSDEVPDLPH